MSQKKGLQGVLILHCFLPLEFCVMCMNDPFKRKVIFKSKAVFGYGGAGNLESGIRRSVQGRSTHCFSKSAPDSEHHVETQRADV